MTLLTPSYTERKYLHLMEQKSRKTIPVVNLTAHRIFVWWQLCVFEDVSHLF